MQMEHGWSAKTSWRLAEPIGSSNHLSIIIEINHKTCYEPVSQDLLDGVEMAWTGPVLQTMSNRNWPIALINLTYLFEFLTSMKFSSLLQLLTPKNQNPARDLIVGWPHTCEAKSALKIASTKRSIKIARSG